MKTISIKAKATEEGKPFRPGDVNIKLSDGTELGLVQSVDFNVRVGTLPVLILETLCNEIELEQLQKDTELKITVKDEEAYLKGYNSAIDGIINPYKPGSYGCYLFEKGKQDKLEKE